MIEPIKRIHFNLFILSAVVLLFVLFSTGCQKSDETAVTPLAENASERTEAVSDDWYKVYFTTPQDTKSGAYYGGPDEALADSIRQARVSVDAAIYDLNLWSIRDALLAADRKGVNVRLVVESEYLDREEIQDLKDAGIPLVDDRRDALMHDKFVVIDQNEIWSGSMNFTINGAYWYDNNLFRIRSLHIAEDYTTEFNEMFVDHQFGSDSPSNTPFPSLTIDGQTVEVYFSPDDHVEARLVDLIRDAKESIYFLAFSFTSDKLADAIIERAKSGVSISGVMDASQIKSNKGGEYGRFRDAGLDVVPDGNPEKMHDKVLIIDGEIVAAGSYNFTGSAARRNDENLVIIHSRDVATLYLQEFDRIRRMAH